VSADVPADQPLLALEVRRETDEVGDVLTLTADAPRRTWSWFADDPFHGGYAFRLLPAGVAPGPWSAVRSHTTPLEVAP
jgi:hypothetical protein